MGEAEVATPRQKREDNPGEINIQEAEPREACDLAPTPVKNGVEGGVASRPQRSRRPPSIVGRVHY